MTGPAYCFTVVDRVIDQLKTGSDADQAKANILAGNRAFAYLGALGPLLRDVTPLSPEEFANRKQTRGLLDDLPEGGILALPSDDISALLRLHRRALMYGYGELFLLVQKQWPFLSKVHQLLDDLDDIAADEDLLTLNARKNDIDALADFLDQDEDDSADSGDPEDESEEKEPFSYRKEFELIEELVVLMKPFLQSSPSSEDIEDNGAEGAAGATFLMTLPATWRESELMRWRRSGEFARALLDGAGDDERLLAYAYGYMIHIAAAVTGQPFVNAITGGPYRSHWWRQRLIANHVDSWVYGYYASAASMTGDEPSPPYEEWQDYCRSNLHAKIDLGLGLSGLELVDAVLGKTADGDDVTQPGNEDLDALAAFLSSTATEVYGTYGEIPLSSLDLAHDFSAESFRRAYLGLVAVLWFQTGGEGPICAREVGAAPPDDCFDAPPDWVEDFDTPPEPGKHKGPLAGSIILAILALLSLLSGGLGAAIAALAGAAGTAAVASDTFWNELRCTLYWTRVMVRRIERKTTDFLVLTTLAAPTSDRLGGFGDVSGAIGPVRDEEGRPLTRTTVPDPVYPRQMDRGTAENPFAPDIGYNRYPVAAPSELPEAGIWPSFGANRYPNFALDGDGLWPLQNGGIMAPPDFPARIGSDGEPAYLGNSVDNAVQVVAAGAAGLANFNLDADRGYGWLAWGTTSPDLPALPAFDPVEPI